MELTTPSNGMHLNATAMLSDASERSTTLIVVQTSVVTMTTVLIFVGNIVNFIVLNSTPLWHRSTRLLLKNLSITDFCIGLSFTLFAIPSAANLSNWPYAGSTVMCDITSFVGGVCCAVSVMTLALISVDRYFIIQRPLDHQNYMSVANVRILIMLAWMIATTLHLLPMVELKIAGRDFSFYNTAAFLCSARYSDFAEHTMVLFFLVYVSTNVIIFGAYFRIIPISLKHSRFIRMRGNQSSSNKRDRLHLISDKSNKSVCTLLCITLVFNICWAPMTLSVLVEVFRDISISSTLEFCFAWLAMFNSFLNTFVYLAMNAKYRTAVRKLFTFVRSGSYMPHRKLSSTYLSTCTKQTEV